MMKKFTFVAAFAALALGAAAQNVAVTSKYTEGDIADGTTVTVPWEVSFDMGGGMGMVEWNPHFTVRSLSGLDQKITVYVTSSIAAQICWPTSCRGVTPGETVSAEGSVNSTGSDIQFDRSIFSDDLSQPPTADNEGTGTLRVVDSLGKEIAINVIWSLQSAATDAVESIGAETAEAEYYSLTGLRVAEPRKGIYIVKRGDKITKQVFK